MFTTEHVVLEAKNCTIDAEIELRDGEAIGASSVFIETDLTTRIYIHPSDLYSTTLQKLYDLAEKQYNGYLLADEA